MIHDTNNFIFSLDQINPTASRASITIDSRFITAMYQQALAEHKETMHVQGFAQGAAPFSYLEQTFKSNVVEHLKEFFFNHCVINFLYQALRENKLVLSGEPQLINITIEPISQSHYLFHLNHAYPQIKNDWKKIIFKAPERKNYKDLDRQVELFIKEETERAAKGTSEEIGVGDWVCFHMTILNDHLSPILSDHKDILWIKIGDEEADQDSRSLFLNKKVGDSFTTKNIFLQKYIGCYWDTRYHFGITILDRVPHVYFSLEQFKKHFKLKTAKETHLKLIEVFSCRNDISQRREMVEALYKILLQNYHIDVPEELIERQKQLVLDAVHLNPDYHVYKAQADFRQKIKLLAIKQLKETIITDFIAHQEDIGVSHEDTVMYLNLLKRQRTKEFVYFELPPTKINGQETIIPHNILKQFCLREKTLNYLIHYLTKR